MVFLKNSRIPRQRHDVSGRGGHALRQRAQEREDRPLPAPRGAQLSASRAAGGRAEVADIRDFLP
jgi:hypothetical protein